MESGKRQGIPIAFLHGDGKDSRSKGLIDLLLRDIQPQGAKGKAGSGERDASKLTGKKGFKTDLVGEKLLDENGLKSIPWIKNHLKEVMEERGNKEAVDRESTKARFLYTVPGKDIPLILGGHPKISKDFNQEAPFADLAVLGFRIGG